MALPTPKLRTRLRRVSTGPTAYRLQRRLDQLRGLDFEGTVVLEEHSNLNIRFSPSGGRPLRDVLAREHIGPTDRIIDVGCGKGTAMRSLLQEPFAEVAGLEFSQELAAIARKNFNRIDGRSRTNVIVDDAVRFDDYDRFNYLYMFNPFLGEVFELFTKNLVRSLERSPRQLTVIYLFPQGNDHLMDTGLFAGPELHAGNFGKEIAVYRHNPG